jgi:hypothetical protein
LQEWLKGLTATFFDECIWQLVPRHDKCLSLVWCTYQHAAVKRFLGAFSKLRKATISFVMSVRPHGTTRLPLDGF